MISTPKRLGAMDQHGDANASNVIHMLINENDRPVMTMMVIMRTHSTVLGTITTRRHRW